MEKSSTAVEQLFPGQFYDAETGLNYNYFRSYNPGTGRYTQSDPIGLNGGPNRYSYANSNSINLFDPQGLVAWEGSLSGVAFLTGAYFSIELTSECVDGKQAVASIQLVGAGIGFGAEASASFSDLKLEDSNSTPDPAIFNGLGYIASAAYSMPPSHTTLAGQAAVIGMEEALKQPHGVGCAAVKLGGISGRGCGPMKGFDIFVGGFGGSSTVTSSSIRECDECGVGNE